MLRVLRFLVLRRTPVTVGDEVLWKDRFGRYYDHLGRRVEVRQ